MPDSADPSRDNSAHAITKRLAKYESIPPAKKEEIDDLPRWVKTALVFWAVEGESYKDAAARMGKSGKTLSMYRRSPAAHKWLESLEEFINDPVAMAKTILQMNAVGVTLDRLAFLQAAINAGDYKEGDRIARDLQEKVGITAKRSDDGPITLKLQVTGGAVEAAVVDSDFEEDVAESDFEIVE